MNARTCTACGNGKPTSHFAFGRTICKGCVMTGSGYTRPKKRKRNDRTSEEIAADLQAFLASGGVIEQVPVGIDTPTHRVGMPTDFIV